MDNISELLGLKINNNIVKSSTLKSMREWMRNILFSKGQPKLSSPQIK